jgi:hypothetical protein
VSIRKEFESQIQLTETEGIQISEMLRALQAQSDESTRIAAAGVLAAFTDGPHGHTEAQERRRSSVSTLHFPTSRRQSSVSVNRPAQSRTSISKRQSLPRSDVKLSPLAQSTRMTLLDETSSASQPQLAALTARRKTTTM